VDIRDDFLRAVFLAESTAEIVLNIRNKDLGTVVNK
jgi:hypothetical protein